MNTSILLHSVYFWLAEPGSQAAVEVIQAGCHEHLAGIPGVLKLSVGVPAGTDRSVVDNSYGVALIVEFADAATQESYQIHPDHLRFIEACSRHWSKVVVYDTLVEASTQLTILY